MQTYREFINSNIVPIIFAYGLAFFSAGLIIAIQPKQLSNFRVARHLWMLAVFGLCHGTAEWGDIFIPIQSPYISEFWTARLWEVQQIIWAVSFVFLLQFGATMIAYHLHWQPRVKTIMLRLLPLWGIVVTVVALYILPDDYVSSVVRYMLGFPGASITAAAFILEQRTFASFQASSQRNMRLISVCFVGYALLAGLTVPQHPLPLLGWFTYENVFTYTLMPVYFWRALIGLCLTLLIINTLKVFDLEYRRRLETAEGERALADERQRIARDLHDGVVQSIYAAGLQLEVSSRKVATEPEVAVHTVKNVIGQLNEVISNIRRYIYNLAAAGENETGFANYIRKIADEISAAGSIPVRITTEGKRVELSPRQKQNIAFITQECLCNIVKHADASEAEVSFNYLTDALVFSVRDNGKGLRDNGGKVIDQNSGRGLKGMKARAEAINADIEIICDDGGSGTLITIRVPYQKTKGS